MICRAYLFSGFSGFSSRTWNVVAQQNGYAPLSLLVASVDICARAVSSCQVGLQVRLSIGGRQYIGGRQCHEKVGVS